MKAFVSFIFVVCGVFIFGAVVPFFVSQLNAPGSNSDVENLSTILGAGISFFTFAIAAVGYGFGFLAWYVSTAPAPVYRMPLGRLLVFLTIPLIAFVIASGFLSLDKLQVNTSEIYGSIGNVLFFFLCVLFAKILHLVVGPLARFVAPRGTRLE